MNERMNEKLEFVVGLLTDVLEAPLANTPEQHIERAERLYGLLHMASEVLVLEVIPECHAEGDMFKRNRSS